MSWTYDANGNRLSENNTGAVSTYAYPSTANALSSITLGGAVRAFAYDAAGNVLTDSRTGALGMTFQYDPEGRLASAVQPATGNGGAYAYDAFGLLSSRTVNQSGSPSTTTLYVYDLKGHVIAETDTSGVTRREYIWMDDLPVAVIAGVTTSSPTLYYVHADHLGRPARMTAQDQSWVWDVIYSPFGATSYIWSNPATMDLRFPGQWFQLETGLAYNWHRHYDPTIGRYLQPDPLGYGGGRNLYAYAKGNPFAYADRDGKNPFLVAVAIATFASVILTSTPANAPGLCDIPKRGSDWDAIRNGINAGLLVSGLGILPELLAAEETAGARGLSGLGGVFSSETNTAGGTIWTSVGDISQNDVAPLVNSGMYNGEVNIISGVHGAVSGSTTADLSLYEADVARFGNLPGVNIYNFREMAPGEISGLLNGPGTTIGGFCNSGACLAPFR